MSKQKRTPKETEAIFKAMTKVLVSGNPKPKDKAKPKPKK